MRKTTSSRSLTGSTGLVRAAPPASIQPVKTFSALARARYTLRLPRSRVSSLARSAGLTERQINAISDVEDPDDLEDAGFSPTERTVLDAVTELCTTRHLSEESFAAVHGVLGNEALTELLMIVSCYYGLGLVLNAVELDAETTSRLQARTGEHR